MGHGSDSGWIERWCGHCPRRRGGRRNLCENIYFMGSASKTPHMQGGFATFFDAIPEEMEEAARIDGASRLGSMVRVTLPLSLPGVITAILFGVILAWDEFLYALIFTSSTAAKTLPVAISEFTSRFAVDYGLMAAGGARFVVRDALGVVARARRRGPFVGPWRRERWLNVVPGGVEPGDGEYQPGDPGGNRGGSSGRAIAAPVWSPVGPEGHGECPARGRDGSGGCDIGSGRAARPHRGDPQPGCRQPAPHRPDLGASGPEPAHRRRRDARDQPGGAPRRCGQRAHPCRVSRPRLCEGDDRGRHRRAATLRRGDPGDRRVLDVPWIVASAFGFVAMTAPWELVAESGA